LPVFVGLRLVFVCLVAPRAGGGKLLKTKAFAERRSPFFLCVQNFSLSYSSDAQNFRQSPGKHQKMAAQCRTKDHEIRLKEQE
jgi:hypothetical protein